MANCGAGMVRLVQVEAQGRVHRALDAGNADLAVALGCVRVAAREEGAGSCTGRKSLLPFVRWRVSMLPPNGPGGMIGGFTGSAGFTPIVRRRALWG